MAEGKARIVRQAASSIILPRVSAPSVNPPTGFDELFMGTDGCLKSLQPDGSVRDYCVGGAVAGLLPNRRFAIITPNGTGVNPYNSAVGDGVSITATGNFSWVPPSASEFGFQEFHTGATINTRAGILGTSGLVYVGGSLNFDAYCLIACPDTANVRLWWVFSLNNDGHLTSDNPATDYVGFRFSTGAGDTNWKFISREENGAAQIIDTGQTPSSTGKWFSMHYIAASSVLSAKIDGVEVAQITDTSKFPNSALNYVIGLQNLTGADKHFRFGQLVWISYK